MKKIILAAVLGVLFSTIALPLIATYPAGQETLDFDPVIPVTTPDIWNLLNKIGNWFFGIVLFIAAIMLVYAGLTYMLAGGDENKVKISLNAVIYSLVGVAIALLSKGLIYIICSFVLGGATDCRFF